MMQTVTAGSELARPLLPAPLPDGEKLRLIGEDLLRRVENLPVTMIKLGTAETVENIRRQIPHGPICACDFYIEGAEHATPVPGGFLFQEAEILLIDHHAPHPGMYANISSGNLASQRVRELGPTNWRIVNNHHDCDSVITRLVMGGEIPPHEIFESAVIAADHTGDEHPIADLLQALGAARDIRFSARNLALLLSGEPLDPAAQKLLDKRARDRAATAAWIAAGNVEMIGRLAIIRFDGDMRNEFLPALVPQAAVFLTMEEGNEGRTISRLRLGKAAPDGFTLFDLKVRGFDPAYGGRWNAGSNKRGGGCGISDSLYIKLVAANVATALESFDRPLSKKKIP